MNAVMNGMSVSGLLPFGGTFFVFSDYGRGAVRLAALSGYKVAFVWSHDSVGVGEDGPTHQPVEQLAAMRAMPGLRVIRPADANETAAGLAHPHRRRRPDRADPLPPEAAGARGHHRRRDSPAWPAARTCCDASPATAPDVVLVGTGSEVSLCVQAAETLAADGVAGAGRVDAVLGAVRGARRRPTATRCCRRTCPRSRSRPATSFGWDRYADATVTIDHFGASAPGDVAMREFGFTPEHVVERARRRSLDGDRSMTSNIAKLNDFGQAPWYDNITRAMVREGGLEALVRDDGIRGVTSNPTIFEKAIAGGEGYDDAIAAAQAGRRLDRGRRSGTSRSTTSGTAPTSSGPCTTRSAATTASSRSRCRRSSRTTPTPRSRRPRSSSPGSAART